MELLTPGERGLQLGIRENNGSLIFL